MAGFFLIASVPDLCILFTFSSHGLPFAYRNEIALGLHSLLLLVFSQLFGVKRPTFALYI